MSNTMKTKDDKIVQYEVNLEALPPLSQEQKNELVHLANLPDEQIDLSDAPELSALTWANAKRVEFYRPLKQPVTICLDCDVLTWFKEHSKNGGYQTEINHILRRHVVESEKKTA